MAGHSHASNIKHKKGRNDKLKSTLFLKLRKKIELIYASTSDREKVFAIAREHNFSKDKVCSIIEKIEKSRQQNHSTLELLYRGKFEVLVYIRGNLEGIDRNLLQKNIVLLSLEVLHSKSVKKYFVPLYILRISNCVHLEELLLSSLPGTITDKIKRIEERGENTGQFEIIFSAEEALRFVVDFLTKSSSDYKLEASESFSPFTPIYINSEAFRIYYSLLEKSYSQINNGLQFFTNVSDQKAGP